MQSNTIISTIATSTSDPANYITVEPGFLPGIPPFSTIRLSPTSAQVNFSQPSSNGDADVNWFVITTQSSGVDVIPKKSAQGYKTSKIISGLVPENTYQFLVQAVNDPGYSVNTTYTAPV